MLHFWMAVQDAGCWWAQFFENCDRMGIIPNNRDCVVCKYDVNKSLIGMF